MQLQDAKQLRTEWAGKGCPPCDHPRIVKEYYLGSQTGDRVCDTCGEEFTRYELEAMGRVPRMADIRAKNVDIDAVRSFLAARLKEDKERADRMRASSANGEWVGIDPTAVSDALDRSVAGGEHVLKLHATGAVDPLHVLLRAFEYCNHPDYRPEWHLHRIL